MEKQKLPFAVHAARWSVIIPIVIIFFNLYSSQSSINWTAGQSLITGVIGVLLYVFGIILAILALRGIKIHGPDKIRVPARIGLTLNSLFLTLIILLVPAIMKVKSMRTDGITTSQYNAFVTFIQNDLMQFVNNETIPQRTFTIEKDGSLAPLMQLLNDGMVIQATESQRYDQKIAHIDIAFYFEPEQLINPESLATARKEVQFLQKAYHDFITTLTEKTNAHYMQLKDLEIPPKIKTGFLDGYIKKQNLSQKTMEQMKIIHFDYMQSILEIFLFMEKKYNNCSLEDGYLVFDQDADYEQYCQLFESMAELEEKLINYADKAMEDVYDEIENIK